MKEFNSTRIKNQFGLCVRRSNQKYNQNENMADLLGYHQKRNEIDQEWEREAEDQIYNLEFKDDDTKKINKIKTECF